LLQEYNFSKGSCLADSPDERFCRLAGLASEEALHPIRGTLHKDFIMAMRADMAVSTLPVETSFLIKVLADLIGFQPGNIPWWKNCHRCLDCP